MTSSQYYSFIKKRKSCRCIQHPIKITFFTDSKTSFLPILRALAQILFKHGAPAAWCSDLSCIMLFMLIWQWFSMLLLVCLCNHLLFFFFPTICWQFLDQGLTFWLCWSKFKDPKWNHSHHVSQLNFPVTVNDQQCSRSSQPFSKFYHLWALYLFICPLIFLYYQIYNLRHSCSISVLPLWILYKSHSGPKSLREFHCWGTVYPNPWNVSP